MPPEANSGDHRAALVSIVADTPWLMGALRVVRSLGLPEWCIGAGAVRTTVWDVLGQRHDRQVPNDVDVAYFDPRDLSESGNQAWMAALARLEPQIPWEVINQAGVHLWYERFFGCSLAPLAPLASLEHAIASWPETATCVGVRLGQDDRLEVIAPLGLSDLFERVIRRNPAVSLPVFRQRLASKRFEERWPETRIIRE